MFRTLRALITVVVLPIVVVLTVETAARAQSGATSGEWPTYGGDLGHTRYAPLDQIDAENFENLEVAWRFKTDNLGPRPDFRMQATPLMVDGVVYSVAGTRRAVVALDAGTGELQWFHSEHEGDRAEATWRKLSGRGLAYWTDGREARIFYVTIGYQLVALDAKTGVRVASFGNNGIVDLREDNDQVMDLVTGDIGLHSTPTVANDVVVIGAAHEAGAFPRSRRNEKGYVRGFDARTGKRLWIFHTIPGPGEFGNETWLNDSWANSGSTGVWAQISVDPELGLAYLPVEGPTGDFYGGHRPGNNLFEESLVAVDLKTGERKWHFQLVHHGLWDMDIPAAPILADVMIDGRMRKIVAQPTKQKWLYTFDRGTGEPIWPIEERPVPPGDVPDEWYSPTQPFPTKPPAYGPQGATFDDLIDFTPEIRAEAVEFARKFKRGPIFTPPVVSEPEGPLATLMQSISGTIWEGGSHDPETGMVYVFSGGGMRQFGLAEPDPRASDLGYVVAGRPPNPQFGEEPGSLPRTPGGGGRLDIRGLPLAKPPYGSITAFDMKRGEIAWQIAHGDTPDLIRNHPDLQGLDIPRTGRNGNSGTLVTKTLLIAGEGGVATQPSGLRGALLRAYDKATGADVGAVYMPAPQSGSPMTYMHGGKQYIVVAISGGNYSGELLAFRLPD